MCRWPSQREQGPGAKLRWKKRSGLAGVAAGVTPIITVHLFSNQKMANVTLILTNVRVKTHLVVSLCKLD